MTDNNTQRWVMALIPIGAVFLVTSIFLPIEFAALTWVLSLACFVAALICAIAAQRQRKTERP